MGDRGRLNIVNKYFNGVDGVRGQKSEALEKTNLHKRELSDLVPCFHFFDLQDSSLTSVQ